MCTSTAQLNRFFFTILVVVSIKVHSIWYLLTILFYLTFVRICVYFHFRYWFCCCCIKFSLKCCSCDRLTSIRNELFHILWTKMLIFILCVVCFCCLVSAGVCVLRVFCFSFVFRRLDVCLQDIIMRLTCNSMQFPLDILI